MFSYLVTFKSGPNAGRSFLAENKLNEADAINYAFKCVEKDSLPYQDDCEYVRVEVNKVPINANQKTVTEASVCRNTAGI